MSARPLFSLKTNLTNFLHRPNPFKNYFCPWKRSNWEYVLNRKKMFWFLIPRIGFPGNQMHFWVSRAWARVLLRKPVTSMFRYSALSIYSCPFSSPEAAIHLASAMDRDLWPTGQHSGQMSAHARGWALPVSFRFRDVVLDQSSSTCYGTSGIKFCWESIFCQMNHYLNDLGRIIPRINEDLCGSKRKRGNPVSVKLLAYFHCGKVSIKTVNKCIAP